MDTVSRETSQIFYSGIGSRKTPVEILDIMQRVAVKLSSTHILRSGGAIGADSAFEYGCNGNSIIYKADSATDESIELASQFHPAWNKCTDYVKKLHGRNALILLGEQLRNPSKFVICWTPDGNDVGGTGLGIRIACHYGIPVVNLVNQHWLDRISVFLNGSDNIF